MKRMSVILSGMNRLSTGEYCWNSSGIEPRCGMSMKKQRKSNECSKLNVYGTRDKRGDILRILKLMIVRMKCGRSPWKCRNQYWNENQSAKNVRRRVQPVRPRYYVLPVANLNFSRRWLSRMILRQSYLLIRMIMRMKRGTWMNSVRSSEYDCRQ